MTGVRRPTLAVICDGQPERCLTRADLERMGYVFREYHNVGMWKYVSVCDPPSSPKVPEGPD